MTEKPKLSGVGELFTRTWGLYSQRFWTFITIGVFPAVVILVLTAFSSILHLATNPIFSFIGIVIFILLTLWTSIALIVAILESQNGMGAVDAYKESWKYLWKYFLLSFFWSILVFCGYLLFVIPGIYLMVALSFAFIILIAERSKEGKVSIRFSIKKSREYVKGYWWAVLGRYLFLLVVVLGFAMLLGLIILLPVAILSAVSQKLGGVFQSVGGACVNILLTPFTTIYWYFIYKDLKQIKPS